MGDIDIDVFHFQNSILIFYFTAFQRPVFKKKCVFILDPVLIA